MSFQKFLRLTWRYRGHERSTEHKVKNESLHLFWLFDLADRRRNFSDLLGYRSLFVTLQLCISLLVGVRLMCNLGQWLSRSLVKNWFITLPEFSVRNKSPRSITQEQSEELDFSPGCHTIDWRPRALSRGSPSVSNRAFTPTEEPLSCPIIRCFPVTVLNSGSIASNEELGRNYRLLEPSRPRCTFVLMGRHNRVIATRPMSALCSTHIGMT